MDKQQIELFTSKKSDNWKTPTKLYKELDQEFKFNFDPCPINPLFNGLKVSWGKSNFVNPPYSKITEFLKKAHYELKNNPEVETIVFLVFANTDTKWFHDYIYKKAEIRFIKGRIKFLDEEGKTPNNSMRPSLVCIFRR